MFSFIVIVCAGHFVACRTFECGPAPSMQECHDCRKVIVDNILPGWSVVGQGECQTPYDLNIIRKDQSK